MRINLNRFYLLTIFLLEGFQLFSQNCNLPSLVVRTGWNYNTGTYFPAGAADPYWWVTADDNATTTEPRPANVEYTNNNIITYNNGGAGAINTGSNTNTSNNWCCTAYTNVCNSAATSPCTSNPAFYGGSGNPSGSFPDNPRIMTFTFCIAAGTNLSALTMTYNFGADDYGKVCLNGNFIGRNTCVNANPQICVQSNSSFFQIGTNTISISLYNLGGAVTYCVFDGVITSTLTGVTPFSDPSCCGPNNLITGLKYWDKNANGLRDPNENVIPSWPIVLKNSSNVVVANTTTDAYGNYIFSGLSLSTYIVEEGTQTGYYQTYPPAGAAYTINFNSSSFIATSIDFGNAMYPCCTPGFALSGNNFLSFSSTANPTVYVGTALTNTVLTITPGSCSGVANYYWDFGDGSPIAITAGAVNHQYYLPGVYTVTITAIGSTCYQQQIVTLTITAAITCCTGGFITSAGFQAFATGTLTGLYTATSCPASNFTLIANCTNATSYSWDFGDGTSIVSGASQIHHYNTSNNTYTVIVTANGPNCAQSNTIVVSNLCISVTNISGTTNLNWVGIWITQMCLASASPSFTATSCFGGATTTWNWGDGTTSTGLTASHTYTATGYYFITVSSGTAICPGAQNVLLVGVWNCICPTPTITLPGSNCVGNVVLSANSCFSPPPGTSYLWNFGDGSSGNTGPQITHNYSSPGTYQVSVSMAGVGQTPAVSSSTTIVVNACDPPQICKDCIGSFAPTPGEYLLSVWVREDINPSPLTYNSAKVQVTFTGDPTVYTFGTNLSKNKIIDGWQKIEEAFTIPAFATNMKLKLINNIPATGPDAYFDDIRILPKDGQTKTYVYDPITLKLSAVLDENNYATFYEYDEEGKLLRVKKETEKGIMTIQENKESLKSK